MTRRTQCPDRMESLVTVCGPSSSGSSISREEIKQLTEDKKDIYTEAKGDGFDVKILKEVIRLRKQDQKERDERDSLLDLYLHALESALPRRWPKRRRTL